MRLQTAVSAVVCVLGAPPAFPAEPPARRAQPCAQAEYRQFDFWLGEWEVDNEGGRRAGTNRIESILDGCGLQEHWTGVGGTRGTSLNMYSAADGRWHQTWIDTDGLRLELSGTFEAGKMVLEGRVPGREPGQTVLHRITWESKPGTIVRQRWQSSADEGATWQDVFVGIYRRRGAKVSRSITNR